MTELLDLCYDVLIRILEEINPSDIAACAATSTGFHEFIKRNERLYKAHYLQNFDDPRRRPADAEPDWVDELQKAVRWQKILESADNDIKRIEFPFILNTTLSLVSSASTPPNKLSQNATHISNLFTHISQNHNAFLSRSSLYSRAGTEIQRPASNFEDRQLSAKLHCLFGIPSSNVGRRVLSAHPFARSKVYDLRNYTDETGWGPFLDDGTFSVDWEMVESLMIVLGYNSGLCCRRFQPRFSPPWAKPLQGIVPDLDTLGKREWDESMLSDVNTPLKDIKERDPYNVSGVWSRIVCFLDYNDLYSFNFSDKALKYPSHEPREALVTDEAIRHIIMDLKVTAILPSEDSDYPMVEFHGTSRSVDAAWDPNANSKIRGSVRMTGEGEVRWQTISVFYGEERWRSEGIQVGGIGAERGVIGTWFDKDFDPHGPAGPTAFWKISDRNLDEDDEDVEEEEQGHHWHG